MTCKEQASCIIVLLLSSLLLVLLLVVIDLLTGMQECTSRSWNTASKISAHLAWLLAGEILPPKRTTRNKGSAGTHRHTYNLDTPGLPQTHTEATKQEMNCGALLIEWRAISLLVFI